MHNAFAKALRVMTYNYVSQKKWNEQNMKMALGYSARRNISIVERKPLSPYTQTTSSFLTKDGFSRTNTTSLTSGHNKRTPLKADHNVMKTLNGSQYHTPQQPRPSLNREKSRSLNSIYTTKDSTNYEQIRNVNKKNGYVNTRDSDISDIIMRRARLNLEKLNISRKTTSNTTQNVEKVTRPSFRTRSNSFSNASNTYKPRTSTHQHTIESSASPPLPGIPKNRRYSFDSVKSSSAQQQQ